jgi:hypothetical protein
LPSRAPAVVGCSRVVVTSYKPPTRTHRREFLETATTGDYRLQNRELLAPDVGSRPLSKLRRPGELSKKRDTDCRCFDVAEVGEVLEMPSGALRAFIFAGLLPVVEVGCRRLVTAGAIVAVVPELQRQDMRSRLDDIENRRGGHRGEG